MFFGVKANLGLEILSGGQVAKLDFVNVYDKALAYLEKWFDFENSPFKMLAKLDLRKSAPTMSVLPVEDFLSCFTLCDPAARRVLAACVCYFKKLEAEAQRRYRAKLSFGGDELPDPFDDDVVRFGFSSGPRNLPPVTAADIYVCLVEGVCFYTREQFKCHKIGDAYNMFLSGEVKQLKSFKAGKRGDDGDGVVLVAATVEASQTLSKQYQACVEASVQYGLNDPSCTDIASKWIEASKGGKTPKSTASATPYAENHKIRGFLNLHGARKPGKWAELYQTLEAEEVRLAAAETHLLGDGRILKELERIRQQKEHIIGILNAMAPRFAGGGSAPSAMAPTYQLAGSIAGHMATSVENAFDSDGPEYQPLVASLPVISGMLASLQISSNHQKAQVPMTRLDLLLSCSQRLKKTPLRQAAQTTPKSPQVLQAPLLQQLSLLNHAGIQGGGQHLGEDAGC
ncbi:hypothetical protein HPB52_000814 [Rhipicephalus sanguineus]|uniref:Uncharacterized protein n=1 Tax=Rhipicephalus sanguineus TaxID=34632 RepID=A0A9D4PTK2_RHISA|nr:hypothetical protein HPB52_000814 [Rhipicephalus sanguineus]